MASVKIDDIKAIDLREINFRQDKTYVVLYKRGKKVEQRNLVLVGRDGSKKVTTYFFKYADCNMRLEDLVFEYDLQKKGKAPYMFALKATDIIEIGVSEKLSKIEKEVGINLAMFLTNRTFANIDWAQVEKNQLQREGKIVTGEASDKEQVALTK